MLPIMEFRAWIDAHRPGNGEVYTLGHTAIAELEKVADNLDREITSLRNMAGKQLQELLNLAEEIDQLKESTAIVHCRDCKHKHEMASGKLACAFRPLMMHETTPLAYCSDGETEGE